jgi:hypothetical protein
MGNNPMLCTIHVAKYKPHQNLTRYSRFGLDKIYGHYKENRARLNQLENEAFYELEVEDLLGYYYESDEVYYKRRFYI